MQNKSAPNDEFNSDDLNKLASYTYEFTPPSKSIEYLDSLNDVLAFYLIYVDISNGNGELWC